MHLREIAPSGLLIAAELRRGTAHPLDDLVLEQFALAAAVALGQDLDALDQSALLQLAVNASTPDPARPVWCARASGMFLVRLRCRHAPDSPW